MCVLTKRVWCVQLTNTSVVNVVEGRCKGKTDRRRGRGTIVFCRERRMQQQSCGRRMLCVCVTNILQHATHIPNNLPPSPYVIRERTDRRVAGLQTGLTAGPDPCRSSRTPFATGQVSRPVARAVLVTSATEYEHCCRYKYIPSGRSVAAPNRRVPAPLVCFDFSSAPASGFCFT